MLIGLFSRSTSFHLQFCGFRLGVSKVRMLITTFRFCVIILFAVSVILYGFCQCNNPSLIRMWFSPCLNRTLVCRKVGGCERNGGGVRTNDTASRLCEWSFRTWIASDVQKVLHSRAKRMLSFALLIEQIMILGISFKVATKLSPKIGMKAIDQSIFV